MNAHLRIARPVADLARSTAMYTAGLGLTVLGSFEDHDGFDGVMLGRPGAGYHVEFTHCRHHAVLPSPTPEDLWVFYRADAPAWRAACVAMLAAGFKRIGSFNPYWAVHGATFADADGFRVVLQNAPNPTDPSLLK